MGMFDYVTVRSPLLPSDLPAEGWQTKDLDPDWGGSLADFEITEQGRLIHHTVRYEQVPETELPYPDQPFIGSMRSIPTGPVDTGYHGIFEFYHMTEDNCVRTFVTMKAKFTDGQLVSLTEVSREVNEVGQYDHDPDGTGWVTYRDGRREKIHEANGTYVRQEEKPDGP